MPDPQWNAGVVGATRLLVPTLPTPVRSPLTYLLLVCGLAGATALYAQEGFELGAKLGAGHYFGDLNTDFRVNDPGLAFGVMARYNFSTRWSTRLAASYTRVAASDADSRNIFERARNLSFRSDVIDAALGLEFNFLQYEHGSRDQFFTPYVFAGLLLSHFNPEAELDGTYVRLRDYGTEGQFTGEEYYTTGLGIDYGLGLKLDLNAEWSLNFEINARQLFSDYLDDVSTVYPDVEDLRDLRGEDAVRLSDRSILIEGVNDRPLGELGRQRGNADDRDQYGAITVGLFYYFGDLKCPDYGRPGGR